MFRYALGGIALALLLTVAGSPSPAPATVPSQAGSQAGTLKVHREYGQGPVTIPSGVKRLRLTFHGREGDKVALIESATSYDPCGKVSLRDPSGKVAAWLGSAWRLPAAGRYSFVVTRCQAAEEAFAQLTKIRLRPLPVDGDPRVLKYQDRGAYEDWATVVVPRRGRVQVRSTSTRLEAPWGTLHLEGYPMLDIANWHAEYERSPQAIYLEAGAPVANELGTMALATGESVVPRAGQRVILVPAENRVRARATKTRAVPGTLGGAPVAVAAERRYQEVGVRFRSAGDQWVTARVDGQLASRSLTQLALTGPDGSTLVGLNHSTMGEWPDLWYLPAAGSYRLTVRTDPEHRSGTVRLSTVRELEAEMPADGQPLAFTAQEPGEWVLATGQLDDPPYALSAEAVGATQWSAFANFLPLQLCRGSFCADYSSAHLTPQSPVQNFMPLSDEGRYLFLVTFGAGQTGTVSLRLNPPSAP